MKKLIKIFYILMILSVVLIIAGITSGASVDSVKDVLTNANAYTPHEQSIDDSFTSIYIKTDNKNIDVSMSNEITKPKLDYYLKDTESVDFQVDEDGELTIDL